MPIPFLIAFFSGLFIHFLVLKVLLKKQVGQEIRVEGPESHQRKKGTPTLGGIGIILATWFIVFIYQIPSTYNFALFFLFFTLGLVGLSDDLLKLLFKRNKGLEGRHKLFGQVLAGLMFAGALIAVGHHQDVSPWLKWLGLGNPWLYAGFVVLVITGSSNAMNLTDGLDGLAAGISAIIFTVYAFICLKFGLLDTSLFCFVLAGVCFSFLWFNAHPAKVFMGDVGALALGGAMGGVALLTHTELPLLIIAIIPVIETLSVMIQVIYFKRTGGKRIFKMTPLHHHFELSGWPETKVVVRAWMVTVVAGIIGYLIA
jgi:phospho-N-acetylmuramoyl-pentapeptide-transferase